MDLGEHLGSFLCRVLCLVVEDHIVPVSCQMARALLAGEDAQVGHLRSQAGQGDLADVAPDKCGMRDRMERLGRKEARPNGQSCMRFFV